MIKHITDFESDDNLRGGFTKHMDVSSDELDNMLEVEPKHILDFEKDDNFRGEA